MKQLIMFTNGEDLPLFSGTAAKAEISPFEMREEPKQESLSADCRFCQDTGVLGEYAFCWCEAGQERKALRRKENVAKDAIGLSSGTIATLTGENQYVVVEQIQASFYGWCMGTHSEYPNGFDTWQEAWAAFAKEKGWDYPNAHNAGY